MKNAITVTAFGEATASPDRASISLGVSSVRPDASAALADVGEKIERLVGTLTAAGVARASLQTADLSLWAETDRNGAPAGYRARNILRIELDDIGRVGEILRVGLDTIGDGAEMNGINFALRDNATVAAVARERAYQAALAKATQLARLAGRGLGQVTSIFETEGWAGPKMMARMEAPDFAIPVEAGITAVTVNLTVRFALVG